MSSAQAPSGLGSALVAKPEHSRLNMLVTATGVHVVVSSRISDGTLIYRHIPFDGTAASQVAAFEDAVYDNPLLLADFGEVNVLIDTPRYIVAPADVDAAAHLAELYPDFLHEVITSPTGTEGQPVIAAAVEPALLAFVRRTFHGAHINHRLSPLCRYFGIQRGLGNTGKLHLHLADTHTDIIAYGSDGLLMANTVAVRTAPDTLYFALAAARHLEFDNANDRVILSGNTALRDELLPLLRKHISFVMPMIFPSAIFKAGHQAMNAPFELTVLTLL